MQSSLNGLVSQLRPQSLGSILNSGRFKRVVDVVGALAALIIFSPIVILCMVAIRLGGEPSVIFRQERVGRNGNSFKILKLSTMKPGAHLSGPLVSTNKDPRVTRVGRIIRPWRLNELPQFVNVLRGEMSLVGPRPEVTKYVAQWAPEFKQKILAARPGITGLATVRFADEGSILNGDGKGNHDVERVYVHDILPVKLQIEHWYVTHRTFWLDLRILLLTPVVAWGGRRFCRILPRETNLALEESS